MNKYPSMPRQLVDRWRLSEPSHPPGQRVPFHYHNAEEWLEVLEGKISFFSAGEVEYRLVEGEALEIPQGEVHRVEIGPERVRYQMWVPVDTGEPFESHMLDDEDLSLVRKNLELPLVENQWDRKNPEALTTEDDKNRAFLDDFLSMQLTFRSAAGKIFEKTQYMARGPGDPRLPSDCIRILHKSTGKDSETVLLSTVVHTQPKEGPRKSFSNYRLFVKEAGIWRCRVWMNHPDPRVS